MKTRPDWLTEATLSRIKSDVANPIDTLKLIDRAMNMVVDGFDNEKLSNKGEVVNVIERLPAALAQLVRSQVMVLQYLDGLMVDGNSTDDTCTLTIVVEDKSNGIKWHESHSGQGLRQIDSERDSEE